MTFFLSEPTETPAPRLPSGDITSFTEGLSGAFKAASIETDANFKLGRTYNAVRKDIASQINERLTPDQRERFTPTGKAARAWAKKDASVRALILGRKAAQEDPDAWADLSFGEGDMDAEVSRRLQEEYQEARALVDMMPGGQVSAEILGGMAGATLDIKNVPFLFLGGGAGSVGRVAAREAAANMAAEGFNLPQQFEMAERLDIEDPSVVSTLALAAGAGAVLGATFEVGARVFRYATQRNKAVPQVEGYAEEQVQAMVDTAEDILASGDPDAMAKIVQIPEDVPKDPPFLLQNPINPERPPLVPQESIEPPVDTPPEDTRVINLDGMGGAMGAGYVDMLVKKANAGQVVDASGTRAPSLVIAKAVKDRGGAIDADTMRGIAEEADDMMALPPDQRSAAASKIVQKYAPDELPSDPTGDIEELTRQADELERQDGAARKPLVSYLRDSHKPRKGDPLQSPGPEMRIDPNGPLGMELKSRLGTNNLNQKAPGLFKKGGVQSMDNLVASEWEADYPGISRATGVADDGLYLDPNGLIDVLVRDIEGDSTWLQSRADAQRLRGEASEVEARAEAGTPLADYKAKEPLEGGLFIDRDAYLFDQTEDEAAAAIEAAVLRFIEERDLGDLLSDLEKREIIDQLQRDGGESSYLVELVAVREADIARAKVQEQADADEAEIPFGETDRRDGSNPGGTEPVRTEAPSGIEGEGIGSGTTRATEATAAGDQTLIDGVAPVTQRDRLEAQQSAPMRGGAAAADDGLFDLGARTQSDMFSEPSSPKFQERAQQQSQYLRDDIEANGDIEGEIDIGDGKTFTSVQQALDYLDEADEFADIIALCGKPKGKAT